MSAQLNNLRRSFNVTQPSFEMAVVLGVDSIAMGVHLLLPVCFTTLLILGAWIVYNVFFHPLAKIPGPFLASITKLWYVVQVRRGSFDKVNRALHDRYGESKGRLLTT